MKKCTFKSILAIAFIALAFLIVNKLPAQSVTLFDPATCNPADLPVGMEIVEFGGIHYLQVVTNGWNSTLTIDQFTLEPGTHISCEFKYSLGEGSLSVPFTPEQIKCVVQVGDTVNKVPNPWGEGMVASSTGLIQENSSPNFIKMSLPINPPMQYVHWIQFYGQKKINWGPTYGDTIWVGKIRVLNDRYTLKHAYTFEDGTANDAIGDAHGILHGGAIVDGVYTSSVEGNYIELPAGSININTYTDITLEALITAGNMANAGYTMLSYFGSSTDGLGSDGYTMSVARGDDISRTAITCKEYTAPWTTESGVNGAELEDGQIHHIVSVLDDIHIKLYIDGELIGSAELSEKNRIENLSNNLAYLCKGGYTADPTWLGSIHEFNIYEGAMNDKVIASRGKKWLGEAYLTHSYTFEKGNGNDEVGDAHGALIGGSIANGVYTTSEQGQYIELPAATIAINTYDAISLEAYIRAGDHTNPSYTTLAHFGNSTNGLGTDAFTISVARQDDISRTFISCQEYSQPWTAEIGINGPELEDDRLHHVVSTLNDNQISFYIDGEFIGFSPLSENNHIENLSPVLAYLCKGGYTNDPTWLGSIYEFNIYQGILDTSTIAGHAQAFLATQEEEADRDNLIAFHNATNGNDWTNKTNWLSNKPIDQWYGVTASNGRVTHLSLNNNNLHGSIPESIGNMTGLRTLNLSANYYLIGAIPTTIGNLGQLEFFNVENCQLSGSIPAELLGLTNLTHLILGNNSFTPAPMPNFSQLTRLTTLSANDCKFTGPIHNGFTQLSNLGMVNLSNNNFTPGPIPNFGSLTHLVNVYLNNCNFTGLIPAWLTQMTWLSELCMSGNQFTGPMPLELANLTLLQNLDLGNNNKLDPGEIPNLSSMAHLRTMYIGNTNRTGAIPEWLGTLTNLNWLSLAANNLTGTVPANLANLDNLNGLYLNNNQLSGTIPNWIGGFPELIDLNLSFNSFSGTLPAEIGNLTKMGYFNVSNNKLTGNLPTLIEGLTRIWYFNASNNQFSGPIPVEIGRLTGMWELHLQNNQLSGAIPSELGNLSNMGYCYLNNNKLSGNIPALGSGGAGQSNPPGTNVTVSFNINSYETLSSTDESWKKIQPAEIGTEALNNLVSLRINNNLFTFANLETSGIVPGTVPTFIYAPQDTLLALEFIPGNNSLTVLDGKATNNAYQWYYNVEALAGATNDTLAGIEPLGGYYCKINNSTYPDLELSSEQHGITEYNYSTDSLALVALYLATQGESWNNHTNWLTGPISTWHGVTVENNRVTRLELQDNNLNGILPFEICYLTGLKKMNLGDNWNLTGTIPSSIDNLALMEDLRIYNTQLSGVLPQTLSNLENLTLLNLGWNNFSPGSLPNLSNAENLQVLLLGNCQLTGSIPSWLLSMPNLRQLSLDHNNFDPGPMPDFSGLTQLNDLNVFNCKFTGEIPANLLEMSQMVYLTIGNNNFTPNPIPNFSSMTGLQLLNANSCHFTGAIPESLGQLTQLWSLQLSSNQLSGNIPEEMNGLVNLVYLNLSNNQLTGSLPVGFGNFPNLGELTLNNNQLSGSVPGALGNCNNLNRLRLANNLFHHAHLEPIMSWGNFAGITDFTYAPQGPIGTEKTWYISEGNRFELEIASYTPSTNDVFQWYKNNVLLPDANGPELVFEAAATANSGTYHCVVSNTVTTQLNLISRAVTLHVGSLGLVGTHNGWGVSGPDEPFVQDAENPDHWSLQYTFTNSGEVKFRWNNDWTINWGNNPFPAGTALPFGPNLPVPAGRYQIDINIASGEYSFENTDSLALVALYDSTGGASWNNHENWLTGPLATWWGVTVENGRVVGLNLGWDNNLNGQLPNQIGDLNAIKWFIASGNNGLTGNIPSTIGNWPSLQTLGLYNCSLTGTIPAEVLTLNQLETIELSFNNFDPSPMPDFGLLPNIQTLTIEACNFTGPIPAGLSGLSQLTRLYLGGNPNLNAGGIPDLSASTNLSVLAMNNCNRTGTLPAWITQMANLQRIILGNNHLSGAIPVNFIDPNNIIEFILGWNNFDEAPMPDLSLLVNLEVVNLANSKLTGGVPGWFTSLSKLNDINLSFNQLEGSIPASLDNLTNLWHLNLEHNHFSGTLPAALANLGALRFAYLNDNAFSGNLPDLSGLAALETLNIRYNRHTFANLATSGLEPSDIDTWLYDPQDTLLAIQKEGTSLTALDCQHPNNQITWFREGTQLAATTRSIEADIDGRYWFTVENSVYTDLTLYSDTIEVSTQEVPEDYQVSAYSISDGNSDCLNAQNNLTVAGDGSTVILLGGSSVNFIAGHSVRFLPGFHAQQGSVAAAWITSDGTFCDSHGARSIVKVESPEKSQYIGISKNTTTNGPTKQVKVYPNPCPGTLNLELLGYIGESQVTVSNMQGSVVYRSVAVKSGQTRHDLSHLSQGMYLLRVQNGQEQFTRKVVIR